ncbi:MAG: glycosyltransferase 87 family protein [Syntrophaceae bacterium]
MRTSSPEKPDDGVLIDQKWIFIGVLTIIYYVLFQTIYKMPYTATLLYFEYASHIMDGDLPYRDFNLEYPPLALVFFLLPRLFTTVYPTYVMVYKVEVFICMLIGLMVIYRSAARLRQAPWKVMSVYTLGILAVGPIIAEQYDLFPAILVLSAIYRFWTGRYKSGWMFLALGTMTKGYPLLIAPIFMIHHLRGRQYRRIVSGAVIFMGTCLAVLLPFLLADPSSLMSLIEYHSQRGIQIESTYGALLLAAHKMGLITIKLAFDHGSWNITGPAAEILAAWSTFIMAALLLAGYGLIYRSLRAGEPEITRIGTYTGLIITITLIASKILSPQYLIWLIPVIPLFFDSWRFIICLAFLLTGACTYIVFPVHYMELMDFKPGVITMLCIRDCLLIFFGVLIAVSLRYRLRIRVALSPRNASV